MAATLTQNLNEVLIPRGAKVGDKEIPLELTVFSDPICPFCYIGYKNLISAVKLVKEKGLPLAFNIKYEAFQLDPTLSDDEPVEKRARYAEKFGQERAKLMEQSMIERGKKVGINFNYDGMTRQTTRAQRLLQKAAASDKHCMQHAVLERLFKGYFEEAKDIGSLDFLSDVAENAGLMSKQEALDFLKTDEMLDVVKAAINTSRKLQIQGVPFTIVASMFGISGAQEPERFLEIFEKVYNMAEENGMIEQWKAQYDSKQS
ncbi:thioredoxin-like protein [Atractiella rhizophila]|nr:thioredoxin-like protein [Atractiella rhizophila]